jgi:glucose-1-phosphate adenylyltransferase
MILAGGRGERLGSLTNGVAKPLVFYGGNYRIIDFTLSNCYHSGIGDIGILTQHLSTGLHAYIEDGSAWNLSNRICVLPAERKSAKYVGTADAVYRNLDYIERLSPKHVLILSCDHIYKMNYNDLLKFHNSSDADMTIASVDIPFSETSGYGIISADGDGRVTGFQEKPKETRSTLASMGVYVFKWETLRKHIIADHYERESANDFGHDLIPMLLTTHKGVFTYRFYGYWRDVGTVESLWKSNMDLLRDPPEFSVRGDGWDIYTAFRRRLPGRTARDTQISAKHSILSGAHSIKGLVEHSVISDSVIISEGAEVVESVIMPNVYIGPKTRLYRTIVGSDANIMSGVEIGCDSGSDRYISNSLCASDVSLIGPGSSIFENVKLQKKSHVPSGSLVETDKQHKYMRLDYNGNAKSAPVGALL